MRELDNNSHAKTNKVKKKKHEEKLTCWIQRGIEKRNNKE